MLREIGLIEIYITAHGERVLVQGLGLIGSKESHTASTVHCGMEHVPHVDVVMQGRGGSLAPEKGVHKPARKMQSQIGELQVIEQFGNLSADVVQEHAQIPSRTKGFAKKVCERHGIDITHVVFAGGAEGGIVDTNDLVSVVLTQIVRRPAFQRWR